MSHAGAPVHVGAPDPVRHVMCISVMSLQVILEACLAWASTCKDDGMLGQRHASSLCKQRRHCDALGLQSLVQDVQLVRGDCVADAELRHLGRGAEMRCQKRWLFALRSRPALHLEQVHACPGSKVSLADRETD